MQLFQFQLLHAKFWSFWKFSLNKKAHYTSKKLIESFSTQSELKMIICIGPCMINFRKCWFHISFTSHSKIFMNWTFNKRHPTCSCVRCNWTLAAFLQFLYVFLGLLFLCLSICSLNKLGQDSYSNDFGKPWLILVAHVKLLQSFNSHRQNY